LTASGDFWSRRKAAVAAEAEADDAAIVSEQAAAERASLEDRSDAEVLEELGLKDPDELEPGDDFSAFLQKAVPERLRQRALRRLWRGNPVLANLDGLVDYGEDYTDAAVAVENIQTAYQVGRGMLKHLLAEAEKNAPPLPEETDLPEEGAAVAMSDAEEVEPEWPVARAAETGQEEGQGAEDDRGQPHFATPNAEDAEPVAPARRRLRFEFAT
jgi:hypothetical protein